MQPQSPKITVAIRKRPISKKQLHRNQTDIIKIEDQNSVIISEMKQKVDLTKYIEETTFNFDYAFDQKTNNEDIYDACIHPLIESAFMGAKVSCFAYGQTGSGKTYTMRGDGSMPGLYYLGAKQIFQYLQHPNYQHLQVNVSFFQIYCGKLFDLLNNRNELKIRQDKKSNINIIGMEQKFICSAGEFLEVIQYGSTFRITSQNATNSQSSRSHAILQINIKDGKKSFTKISFIDLAGNERGADHMDQNKQTKIDGAEINKSLLALKECIRALDQGKGHTPFRGSKLTMVLKDSFVGFCKTVMIGNVSPNVTSAENTMNTLRYADRVKQLKNGDVALTREELAIREMMLPRANKNTLKVNIDRGDDQEDIEAKKEIARRNKPKDGSKIHNLNDMDVEPPRRKTELFSFHQDNILKKEPSRKSMNMMPLRQHSQPQDQNNPKNRNFNFVNNPSKQFKTQNHQIKLPTRQSLFQHQQNKFNKNKSMNIPRTQIPNQYKLQQDYHHLMQEIENMKQKLLDDQMDSIKQESFIIKEQSQVYDKASRSTNLDLSTYLSTYRNQVNRKLEIFTQMKSKVDYLSARLQEAQQMNRKIEISRYDEQLLEGLPCDDFGSKLF